MSLAHARLAGLVAAVVAMAAMSPVRLLDERPESSHFGGAQFAVACPNTGELVIDKVKICYFTCPDISTSIRIGADDICPPFH
jgi:hypothetical protein